MTDTPRRVVIVGAGLAGLSAAGHLQRAGLDVRVLEASDGVGGRVRSDVVDGHVLDRGFQVLLTAYPEAARQLDLGALDLHAFEPGALVWHHGRGHVVSDPFRRPATALSTATAPIGTPLDKLRLARMRHRLRAARPSQLLAGPETSTIDALRDRGFSPTMIDRFLRPLFAGIQLDPSLATSSRMSDVIFRMLSDGDAAVPAGGMGRIPLQLAGGLRPGTMELGVRVRAVHRDQPSVVLDDGTNVDTDLVIVATDGPAASELLGLPAVASRSVGCVWFSAPSAPIEHKLIVLDASGTGPALNVAVMSNVVRSHAPAGRHLIAAATPADIGDDLEGRVRAQLRGWWGTQVDRWDHLRTDRIAHGQPDQSPPFAPKRRVRLAPGVFVCGDHRDTGSIQGALFSGRRCAEAVLAGR